jgi:hypothetical protein
VDPAVPSGFYLRFLFPLAAQEPAALTLFPRPAFPSTRFSFDPLSLRPAFPSTE